MTPQMLRNMTSDELIDHVEHLDTVPRDVVRELIAALQSDEQETREELDEANDVLRQAIKDIQDIIDNPLDSAELYHKALKVWVSDWEESE